MRGECPSPRPECPYFDSQQGCFSDTHHIYFPKGLFSAIMENEFRELPENKQQLCRFEHEELHEEVEQAPKPDIEEMRSAVRRAYEAGEIHLSKNKRRKLGL